MPQPDPAAPYPAAAPAPTKPKGAVGIWIGVLLIIGGIILGIVLIVAGAKTLLNGFDDLQRVPIRTGGTVDITDTGTQTVYAERATSETGTSFNSSTFSSFGPDITVVVTGPDGAPVSVRPLSGSETYVFDGRQGVSIAEFTAETEGRYAIRPIGADGAGLYTTIAVGTGLKLSGIGAILGGVFGGGAVVLIGIIVTIIFGVRRSRSKKRIALASAPYGAYGAAPGAGWPANPAYQGAPAYGGPGGPGTPGAPGAPGWAAPPVAAPGWVPPPAPPAAAPPSAQPWEQPVAPWQPLGSAEAAPPPPPDAAAPEAAPPVAPWTPPDAPVAPPPAWGSGTSVDPTLPSGPGDAPGADAPTGDEPAP